MSFLPGLTTRSLPRAIFPASSCLRLLLCTLSRPAAPWTHSHPGAKASFWLHSSRKKLSHILLAHTGRPPPCVPSVRGCPASADPCLANLLPLHFLEKFSKHSAGSLISLGISLLYSLLLAEKKGGLLFTSVLRNYLGITPSPESFTTFSCFTTSPSLPSSCHSPWSHTALPSSIGSTISSLIGHPEVTRFFPHTFLATSAPSLPYI